MSSSDAASASETGPSQNGGGETEELLWIYNILKQSAHGRATGICHLVGTNLLARRSFLHVPNQYIYRACSMQRQLQDHVVDNKLATPRIENCAWNASRENRFASVYVAVGFGISQWEDRLSCFGQLGTLYGSDLLYLSSLCADCGLPTGVWCDSCSAPLCSFCDRDFGTCCLCSRVHRIGHRRGRHLLNQARILHA